MSLTSSSSSSSSSSFNVKIEMVDDADDGVDLFLSVFDREKFSTHFGTDGKQTSNSIGGVRIDFPITLEKN
jgi:hypothetical protein